MPGLLNYSPADVLSRLLISKGYGSTPPASPWPIFVTTEPDSPDSVITLFDTQGRKFGRRMHDGSVQEIHGVQIRVRAISDVAGYRKARELAIALDTDIYRDGVTIGGDSFCVLKASRTGEVVPLGPVESSRRLIFTINALVYVTQTN